MPAGYYATNCGGVKKLPSHVAPSSPRHNIDFERDRSIGLGSTFGDGQTDTHRHFFLKHFSRMWECYTINNHKKIEVEFFDDCNTFFTPNVTLK